jgi:uncharacterized membrane protein
MIDILRKVYLPTAAVGIVVDLVWIGLVAQRFYQRTIGGLLRDDVQWAAAAAFYLLYVAAILVFVVQPAIERESLTRAVAMGAFLGIVAYGTYDLTSLALIRGFPASGSAKCGPAARSSSTGGRMAGCRERPCYAVFSAIGSTRSCGRRKRGRRCGWLDEARRVLCQFCDTDRGCNQRTISPLVDTEQGKPLPVL